MADTLFETAQRYTSQDYCAGLHHKYDQTGLTMIRSTSRSREKNTRGSDGSKNGKKEAQWDSWEPRSVLQLSEPNRS